MTTKNTKVKLTIEGKEVTIGHEFLEDTVRNIPDIKENKEIFDILAQSDNPEVREDLVRMGNLSKKTIHLLLNDENQEVVDNVLSNPDLAKYIKHKALMHIINGGNIKLLKSIANSIEDYEKCDLCEVNKVLSEHKNVSVRYALVRYTHRTTTSTKALKILENDVDLDVKIAVRKVLSRRS